MAERIVNMRDRSGSAKHSSPQQTLQDAIDCVGKVGALENGKKVLILALDDIDGNYDVSFFQAGMTMSQCLALCEVAKIIFLEDMGFL